MKRTATRIDRHPAKMVSHLADRLVSRYGAGCEALLDPFCGSGAVLVAAQHRGVRPTGIDINPYATLMSGVKLAGFPVRETMELCHSVVEAARSSGAVCPVRWQGKEYWFTPGTLHKYEKLRSAARRLHLNRTKAGRAVLLALALSVRLCSRADQRSPKPFISRAARQKRQGRHFDPYSYTQQLLRELSPLYSNEARQRKTVGRVVCADVSNGGVLPVRSQYPVVITSPPYINAQDYYRNFKLELHILESILPFRVDAIRERFIGTERGLLMRNVSERVRRHQRSLLPELVRLERQSERHAAIVHRYLADVGRALENVRDMMDRKGILVLVCGDNLVGGIHIRTWRVLGELLAKKGFVLEERFADTIQNRMVPPNRMGHRGLIKEEWVSVFRRQ